ncbi:hypothetical protein SLE2022_397700 [Rubroshorea leprosula]
MCISFYRSIKDFTHSTWKTRLSQFFTFFALSKSTRIMAFFFLGDDETDVQNQTRNELDDESKDIKPQSREIEMKDAAGEEEIGGFDKLPLNTLAKSNWKVPNVRWLSEFLGYQQIV